MKKTILLILLTVCCCVMKAQQDSVFKTSGLLDLSLDSLMNINVYTASKKYQKVSDAPAIISVVTNEEIRRMGVISLIDVLKYIPGIEISMESDGHYRLSLRGTRKDGNVLLLINDHRMNDFYNGRNIYDLPADFIDKIEIIRGPGSALFGSNAVAGVVNVFTVKEKKISAAGGTNATFSGNLSYFFEKENVRCNVSAGYIQSDGANSVIEEDAAEQRSWSLTNESNNFITKRWNKNAYLNTELAYKKLKFNFFNINQKHGAWAGPHYIAAYGSKFQTNQLISNISYDFQINDGLILSPKIYCSTVNHDYLNQETPSGYVSVTSGDVFLNGKQTREQYVARSYGAELAIHMKVNEHFEILTGNIYEYQYMPEFDVERNYKIVGDIYKGEFGNHDNIELTQREKHRYIFAYHIQGHYNREKLNITAGLRYDAYNDFGQSYNPRIGITYRLSKIISFKGLYGKAFRAPTFQELYDNSSLGNTYGVKGNEKLQPSGIQVFELGVESNYKKVIVRYNLFYNLNKNLIRIYDPHGSGSIGVYENIGNMRTYGNEAEIIFLATPKLSCFVNYSQFISEFEWNKNVVRKADLIYFENQSECDRRLKNIPTLRLNAGINWKIDKFILFAGLNYGGASENNKRFYLEESRFARIPPYLQANFSITYNIKKFQIRVVANNIGKKYSDPEESTNINAFGEKGLIQPSATFLAGVYYKF